MTSRITRAVYEILRADPAMPKTVQLWYAVEADPEARVLQFATSMAENLIAACHIRDEPGDSLTELYRLLLLDAMARVDWVRVARALLRRFPAPAGPLGRLGGADGPPRPSWLPRRWEPSRN